MTVKDVLWLRALLLPAQISFLSWGAFSGQMAPVAWNIVLMAINGVQIVRILLERRPIELPEELSFLSHERASADVVAVGELQYNSWNQDKPRRLAKINPELYQKLQHILSPDVTNKIKTTSDRMGEIG
jgi:hypothetical protein